MRVVYAVACIALGAWVDAQAAVCVTKNKKGVIKSRLVGAVDINGLPALLDGLAKQ